MTEDEMKNLRCCGPTPHNTGNSNQQEFDRAAAAGLPIPYIYFCSGSQCAGWNSEKDIKEKDGIEGYLDGGVNLVRPTYKTIKAGHCGLKNG